jgi:hypothetical protein
MTLFRTDFNSTTGLTNPMLSAKIIDNYRQIGDISAKIS